MAARKRRAGAGRGRSRKRRSRRLVASSACLLSLAFLVVALRTGGCHRASQPSRASSSHNPSLSKSSSPRPEAPQEERQIALRLEQAIERAGAPEVWVKGSAGTLSSALEPTDPPGADAPVEVLAIPATFEPVLSAIKQEAQAQSLRVDLRSENPPGESSVADITLYKGQSQVGRWRLREVPQLFRAAIVIDDLGNSLDAANELLAMAYPLTFSVLPHLRYSGETAEEAHRAGREVMLHLPMEPEGARFVPGDGVIRVGMPAAEVASTLAADLASVSYAGGVNNHMGSRATTDPRLMRAVMRNLAERRLFFIDSRTTADTVAFDEARKVGVPSFFRSVFLDDTETVPYSLGQLDRLCQVVKQQGAALAIGHPYPSTLAALRQFLPQFERDDIQLVPASALVRLPEVAAIQPPRRQEQQASRWKAGGVRAR